MEEKFMALDKWKKLIGGEEDNNAEGEEAYYNVTKEDYQEVFWFLVELVKTFTVQRIVEELG